MARARPAPTPDTDVRVRAYSGQTVDLRRVFLPLAPGFLMTSEPVPFRVYVRARRARLRVLLEDGVIPSLVERRRLENLARDERLYVRGDQQPALLRFQEDVAARMLQDPTLDLDLKCRSLHNLLSTQLKSLLDAPGGLGVYRLRECVVKLLAFLEREPEALSRLVGMAHRRFSVDTHCVNVGFYALVLARTLFGEQEDHDWTEMVTAFFCHDLGRAKVRSDTHDQGGPLTAAEWWEMKRHPDYGYFILERGKVLTPQLAAVVRQHHERMDGGGYPEALAGTQIHPYARICAIADAYDALTTERSYRPALGRFDTLAVMKAEMETQFDPEMFKIFVRQLRAEDLT